MARNEEKSQSMLFRFREAQAAELGLSGRTDKRPRVASSCTDLRQCERWRGEILRDISRKVSKIQDEGLTDYEIRDLNDEINKLLREKHHWEKQIVACGGANYKRAAGATTDRDGREVPGARGYKYFGRAKELPGVRELFQTAADANAEAESFKVQKHDMFNNVGSDYYGDQDEGDEILLSFEKSAEVEAWEDACDHLQNSTLLQIQQLPSLPLPSFISLDPSSSSSTTTTNTTELSIAEEPIVGSNSKRKAAVTTTTNSKKLKLDSSNSNSNTVVVEEGKEEIKKNGFISILREEDLKAPKLISKDELENLIIKLQKEELLAQFT